jgi:hypothetical protein
MQCPVCKAENTQGPTCRRCKADLSLLFRLETQHKRLLVEARRRLGVGDVDGAWTLATRADGLCRDDDSRRVLAVAALLAGNFEQALRYRSCNGGQA